jgi:Na+/H+ antiporter NhaA
MGVLIGSLIAGVLGYVILRYSLKVVKENEMP